MSCEPEEAQNLTEELPNPTSYSQERPGVVEGDKQPLSWTAASSPNRGSDVAPPSDHLYQEGWQGQLDPARMANYWSVDSSGGHGHAGRSRSDNAYALMPQHEPQSWSMPSHTSARYDLPPSPTSYAHRSVARELENNSGQTSMMVERTGDEEASSVYGSPDGYTMPARGVGDHHPNIWLPNQRANRQLTGAPPTFPAPGTPNHSQLSHLSMHPQENAENIWSNRRDSAYGVQLQYPQSDSFSGPAQTPEGSLYSSGPTQSNVTGENEKKYFGPQ